MRYSSNRRYTFISRIARKKGQLLLHARRQMPIGQGGFHVGGLRRWANVGPNDTRSVLARADYLYVYDCGAEPKRHVHREINALIEHRASRKLDLLVLSHFDRDHICGTPHLLRAGDGLRVDTIMLPFVDMDERIVALAQAAAETHDNGGRIDSFFLDMVFDPVGTLAQFGPRRILLVRGDDDEGPLDLDRPGIDPDAPTPASKHRIMADFDRAGPSGTKLIGAYDDPQRPASTALIARMGATEVREIRNLAMAVGDTKGSFFWKLLPWVRRADPADVARFRARVETLFTWPVGSFGRQVQRTAVRKQMVTTKRTALARAYKEAFGDKNLTSLCLYSGPLNPIDAHAIALMHDLPSDPLTKIGWLGTGDAHLKEPADISAFRRGYGAELDLVSTYLLPHHGSIENSDPNDLIVDADLWVAAADPLHPWAHPHWELQAAVARMGRTFHHVRASEFTASEELFAVTGLS